MRFMLKYSPPKLKAFLNCSKAVKSAMIYVVFGVHWMDWIMGEAGGQMSVDCDFRNSAMTSVASSLTFPTDFKSRLIATDPKVL